MSWQSVKQKIVVLSSCEAEYMAVARATCQEICIKRLIGELLECEGSAAKLCVNNKSTIMLRNNPVFHDRSKHIELRYHFLRQCVDNGNINI